MKGPAYVTFEQADSGRPGALAVAEIEAIWSMDDEDENARTVIRTRSGQKYEVCEPVAGVLARIESVSERDG